MTKSTRRKSMCTFNVNRVKLNPSIKNKCAYGILNDRGSIFTMGFKLNHGNVLDTPKNMEVIYKEESHIHQFIIPFETAVWNEEDLPPRRSQKKNAAENTEQRPQQNINSGSEQNTQQNNEQQNPAQLPQRATQNRGGSLQA